MKNKVSLIIPIYNSEEFLKKCLDSVCNQTYQNYEVILIDDGSKDNSFKICNEYCLKYQFIKYIKIENAGVSNARNIGIKESTGEFITFVDADDYIDKNLISSLVNEMLNKDIDIVISNAIDVDVNGNVLGIKKLKNNILLNQRDSIKSLINKNYFYSTCWGNLYKSSIIKKNNILFDTSMRIAEDGKFLYTYLSHINKNCLVLKDHYYYYVVNDKSTVHSGFTQKWWDEINWSMSLIENYRKDEEMFQLCEIYFINLIIRILWKYDDIDKNSKIQLRHLLKTNFNYVLFKKIGIKNKIKAFICLIK